MACVETFIMVNNPSLLVDYCCNLYPLLLMQSCNSSVQLGPMLSLIHEGSGMKPNGPDNSFYSAEGNSSHYASPFTIYSPCVVLGGDESSRQQTSYSPTCHSPNTLLISPNVRIGLNTAGAINLV